MIVVATLTGGSGGTIAGGTTTMAGAATAGVEIAGTTVGVGTADEQTMAARGATATFVGGTIATIVDDGTDGTTTGGGTIDRMIDARAVIGHATFAGGVTKVTKLSAVAPTLELTLVTADPRIGDYSDSSIRCYRARFCNSQPSNFPILDTFSAHSHNANPKRMWRNWQTRRSQKPVMVTSWRFKSSHPHQFQD